MNECDLMRIETRTAPKSLISERGMPSFGYFDGPVTSLGLEMFAYYDEMDKPASTLSRYFHYKQFQFVSVVTPHYIIGVSLADIRYAASAFCYLYDINKNRITETRWLKPLGLGYKLTPSPMEGIAEIAGQKGMMAFHLSKGVWSLSIDTLHIKAELTLSPPVLSLPMAMCNPTGYSGWTYTQKHNGLKPRGQLTINDEPQPLNMALASYDFSAGYMRRETSWRWACINAHTDDGVIGVNLAAGVNETGCNENVFWIHGERHLLGAVHFDFARISLGQKENKAVSGNKKRQIWRIYSHNGQVELAFKSLNCRQEKLNLLLLKTNFRQYIGHYSGYIIDNSGVKHIIDNVLGLAEDHFALW
ncbi:DUF2804 domain-containing protein [Shewanella sp. VB17]|uniref:DUF2804 domain-containing protein n=1 Tax=Shewanella sp. VB17 TaxID=2739432 RepID=UPI00156794E7|nr:DUF2804 domain-containing protein [Shewanella sp. VB17]NRD75099.1 DUF2804 domain-containing protein [Shewanella sp. VB17]